MFKIDVPHLVLGILFLLVIGYTYFQNITLKATIDKLEQSRNNEKAYSAGIDVWRDKYNQEHTRTIVFEESLKSLRYSNDSITKKIMKQLELQGVKLKKLDQLVYQEVKIDTSLAKVINIPTMPDTTIDLSNQYITNIIKLSPTMVTSKVELDNELYGNFIKRKETINTPNKFFLFRLFQRKHVVIEGDFYNTNPLIKTKSQKIIQIVD